MGGGGVGGGGGGIDNSLETMRWLNALLKYSMFKSCYKKCFANNNDDSKSNEMLYSVKLNVRVINGEETFRFYILFYLKVWQNYEMEVCLLKGREGDNISRQILLKCEQSFS